MIKNILKNQRGFSLTELTIAASIFTLLTFGSLSIMEYMKGQEEKITRIVSQSKDEEFLNKFMYQLIASGNLGISYGVLNRPDKNGFNFFDLIPDYHTLGMTEAQKTRTVELTNNKNFVFLSGYNNFQRLRVIELFDYQYDTLVGSEGDTNSLEDGYFNNCYLKEELANVWKENGLLLFYVPVFLRNTFPVDMQKPPKKPAFIAKMLGKKHAGGTCAQKTTGDTTFSADKYGRLGNFDPKYFNFENPVPDGRTFRDINDFVLKAHLIGGQDVIFAGGINIVMVSIKNNTAYHCVFSKGDQAIRNCGKTNGLAFAENIHSISFLRKDITNTQISVSFCFQEEECSK